MGAFIRRHRWLSASLMLVAGSIGWWVSGGIRGQLVAYFDVARGHYGILSLGLPAPWRSEFARILRERYGIEQRVVAGCVVSPVLLAYTEGYNRVSMTAANRKFVHDVFKESAGDAMRRMPPLVTRAYFRIVLRRLDCKPGLEGATCRRTWWPDDTVNENAVLARAATATR
jgi:hypothetical protein